MNAATAYVVAAISVVATSAAGGYLTDPKTEWYQCIKPSFTPPSIVFPIVWTVLYVLIAVALARTLLSKHKRSSFVVAMFYANLALNVVWCLLFFKMKQPLLALVAICVLFVSTAIIMWYLYAIKDNVSVILLVPYILWIAFATSLTAAALRKQDRCAVKAQR